MELIDYAEQQGQANFAWQTKVNETTRQEANLTLGFLITGGGAAVAWVINQLAGPSPDATLAFAVFVMALWLFALAASVQFKCLKFKLAMPPANQPLHVYQPQYNTLSLRAQQLSHLEQAIIYCVETGQEKAKALRRLRMAACFTPLVFLAAWVLAACCFQ
jgi:hypothetical protein